MYVSFHKNIWNRIRELPPYNVDNIVLCDEGKALFNIIDNFRQSKRIYKKKSIPYVLNILLHGEPGNGKSSLIKAIATKYNMHIGMCLVNNIPEKNAPLLYSTAVKNTLFVWEDLRFGESDKVRNEQFITKSTFLNILDGVYTVPGTINILTTNYLNELDTNIIRPERIHHIVELKSTRKLRAELALKLGVVINVRKHEPLSAIQARAKEYHLKNIIVK